MDDLIEQNMGLVVSIVNSFNPRNQTERQDLIDAGRIGLWKALQKYDKDEGSLISTYAWRPIRWSIIREIKSKTNNVNIEDVSPPFTEKAECLWEYIPADITTKEKQVINLRCEGYKFNEICDITGESSSIIKNRFYKALKKIKESNNV